MPRSTFEMSELETTLKSTFAVILRSRLYRFVKVGLRVIATRSRSLLEVCVCLATLPTM